MHTLRQRSILVLVGLVALGLSTAAAAQTGTLFVEGDKVGIGTPNPLRPLHLTLDGSDPSVIRLEQPGPSRIEFRDTTSGVSWDFRTTSGDTFVITKFGTGVNEFKVNSLGDLTVSGSLNANNGSNTFPDYVFDSGYELMPLADLQAFIQEKRHLPGVISSAEVQEAGSINVSKLQLQLLEKVEELTLYVLEQQREIAELRAQLQEERAEDAPNANATP